MQRDNAPVTTDLVLIGGGHSHLFVLRQLAMNPLPGLRVTLVTRDLHTPYSGMLPGYIAGHYDFDETHIDLLPLARFAGVRVVHAEVEGIDCHARRISLRGRPPMDYDLLSINTGSRPLVPELRLTESDRPSQAAVKPVDRFIEFWQILQQRLLDSTDELKLAIVGGGAGGVELALSLQYRAQQLEHRRGRLQLCLLTDSDRLLPGHNTRVRDQLARVMRQRSIEVLYGHRVSRWDGSVLQGEYADPVAADAVVWVTTASPAPWLRQSGLSLDEKGFVRVNPCLQSESHAEVFATGDVASVTGYPRPRSGVFAVRQGLPLARNLLRKLKGHSLQPYSPQTRFLSLISTGDRYAIASRGRLALKGRWCWWLKDRIDRRFVERFSDLPPMLTGGAGSDGETVDIEPMHCGGCGSKIGSAVLQRVLERVHREQGLDVPMTEDAAVVDLPAGVQLLQTVDGFRSFIDDPYLFGRIAANHALGDLFAMGAEAHSALVTVNVVYGSEARQAEDLYQLMRGVIETLSAHDTRLLGGHSGEAEQLYCGLSVNGVAPAQGLLRKGGMRAGQLLLLTKPIGSGVLFAADMRARARGEWFDTALEQMLLSNRAAARCLLEHAASACTDVTGFGLAGHLYEMASASCCSVEIDPDRVPLMSGALELSEQGISSSLQPQNLRIRHRIEDERDFSAEPRYPLLFDPQTAGGLLASLAPEQAQACLVKLRGCGYADAEIIGRVTESKSGEASIRLSRLAAEAVRIPG